MVQIKLVLLTSNLRKACIIQEQFEAKLNVWRTTTKTFLRSTCSQVLAVCFNMSQKIAKLWGLSALATKLLFRQIYCHNQPFTSADGFLKRLTKNKSLKFEVEFFGNVGATRETKEDDKKNCPLMFLGLFCASTGQRYLG